MQGKSPVGAYFLNLQEEIAHKWQNFEHSGAFWYTYSSDITIK
jgi:hypothetical protein